MRKKRYGMLDSIRGATIVSMILYHAVWDLVYLFHMDWQWYQSTAAYAWQQSICWIFIFLSGFCWPLGRKPFRRGLYVFVAGALVTVATSLVMPENRILFGVLTLLGTCMLLLIPLKHVLDKVSPYLGLAGCVLLFLLTKKLVEGSLSLGSLTLLQLPSQWYQGFFMTFLGFMEPGFYSSDYFPLFPWMFLFLAGYFAHRLCMGFGVVERHMTAEVRPFSALGKHTLLIYVLHQPILYGCLSVFFTIRQAFP